VRLTGDLQFVVRDELDGSTPVDIDLSELLGDIPVKTFEDTRSKTAVKAFGDACRFECFRCAA